MPTFAGLPAFHGPKVTLARSIEECILGAVSPQATTSEQRRCLSESTLTRHMALRPRRGGCLRIASEPTMHTQPTPAEKNEISSLDRTDVLPVLDVEAYEEQ